MVQGESRRSRQIMVALRARGCFCFKVHGSALMMAGLPDIIGCYQGLFFAFETKLDPHTTPSPRQRWVMRLIRQAGGWAAQVTTPADALGEIDAMVA